MTVEDCLYALLLSSVNQSANAWQSMWREVSRRLWDMMNQKLTELGLQREPF